MKKGCGELIELVCAFTGTPSMFAIECGDHGNYCEKCSSKTSEAKDE